MTATPKVYKADSTGKDGESLPHYAMDNPKLFGEVFYRYSFKQAIDQGRLTDYKVIVYLTTEAKDSFYKSDPSASFEADFYGKILGSYSGFYMNPETGKSSLGEPIASILHDRVVVYKEQPKLSKGLNPSLKKAIIYTSSIKNSKAIAENYAEDVQETYHKNNVEVHHIDGTMNSHNRHKQLDWLKKDEEGKIKILSNAKCLTEGIDVPNLDAVIFFNPRNSQVDITQAIGRAIRRAKDKDFGYIMVPIVVESLQSPEEALENSRYSTLWSVLQGLRSMDEAMDVEINSLKLKAESRKEKFDNGEIVPGEDENESSEEYAKDYSLRYTEKLEAVTLKKCGTSLYWPEWVKNIGKLSTEITDKIKNLCTEDSNLSSLYEEFREEIDKSLNKDLSDADLINLLSQQVIFAPVLKDLFGEEIFSHNPMAIALRPITEGLSRKLELDKDPVTCSLWDNIRTNSELLGEENESDAKDALIRKFYNEFYNLLNTEGNSATPSQKKKLGVVYTPPQIVDFMLYEINELLKSEFGDDFSSKNIQILDPFSGTGTYIARLLSNRDFIDRKSLNEKYANNIWANEILLMPYYIMSLNVQNAYLERCRKEELVPNSSFFKGGCFTDTFYSKEIANKLFDERFDKNAENVKAESRAEINVTVSNPPYSSRNDNDHYTDLDRRIFNTYAKGAGGNLKNSLYDSYIRAFRWASDRIGNKGIIGFITNSSWLSKPVTNTIRKSFQNEFDDIYVVDLRGNIRDYGNKAEGGNVFDIQTPVAITFLIKNPNKNLVADYETLHRGKIHYVKTKDSASKYEKFNQLIKWTMGEEEIPWINLTPNSHDDWLIKRKEGFNDLIPVFDKSEGKFNPNSRSIFTTISLGISTNRDAWTYNFSKKELSKNIDTTINFYNEELWRWEEAGEPKDIKDFVRQNPQKIHWTRDLRAKLGRGQEIDYNMNLTRLALYRPFAKTNLYYGLKLIDRPLQIPRLFPQGQKNLAILFSQENENLSSLMANTIPNLHTCGDSQCLPLYWYEKQANRLFASYTSYERHSAISRKALELFRTVYKDESISPEDIFYYVYGILNSKEYKNKWSSNFKYEFPHIPLSKNFRELAKIGKELGILHADYESAGPYAGVRITCNGFDPGSITAMKLEDKGNSLRLQITKNLSIADIPKEALDYKVGVRSPLEWIVNQYRYKIDKDSGIINDPNAMGIEYIKNLALSLITVSLKSAKLINSLPEIDEVEDMDYKQIWKKITR